MATLRSHHRSLLAWLVLAAAPACLGGTRQDVGTPPECASPVDCPVRLVGNWEVQEGPTTVTATLRSVPSGVAEGGLRLELACVQDDVRAVLRASAEIAARQGGLRTASVRMTVDGERERVLVGTRGSDGRSVVMPHGRSFAIGLAGARRIKVELDRRAHHFDLSGSNEVVHEVVGACDGR